MDQSLNGQMNKAADKANVIGRDARNAASDAKNAVTEAVNKFEIPEAVSDQLEVLRKQTKIALDRTEDLVKAHPFYSILGAAAVGALVATYCTSKINSKWYQQ